MNSKNTVILLALFFAIACGRNNDPTRIRSLEESLYAQWYENGVYHEIIDTNSLESSNNIFNNRLDIYEEIINTNNRFKSVAFDNSLFNNKDTILAYSGRTITPNIYNVYFRSCPAGYAAGYQSLPCYISKPFADAGRFIKIDSVIEKGIINDRNVFIVVGTFNDTLQKSTLLMDSTCQCISGETGFSYFRYNGKFRLACYVQD